MPCRTKHFPLFLLLAVGLASASFGQQAATGQTASAPGVAVAKAVPTIDGNYVLSAQDVVEITVFQEEELGVKARIGEDGTVAMPLIGAVRIGGRTVRQAQLLIED